MPNTEQHPRDLAELAARRRAREHPNYCPFCGSSVVKPNGDGVDITPQVDNRHALPEYLCIACNRSFWS